MRCCEVTTMTGGVISLSYVMTLWRVDTCGCATTSQRHDVLLRRHCSVVRRNAVATTSWRHVSQRHDVLLRRCAASCGVLRRNAVTTTSWRYDVLAHAHVPRRHNVMTYCCGVTAASCGVMWRRCYRRTPTAEGYVGKQSWAFNHHMSFKSGSRESTVE